jgi:seryl-tRNA synthetase
MIDLADLRERPDAYQTAADQKNVKISVKSFLTLDSERRDLIVKTDEMRAKKNTVSKDIPSLKGKEKEEALADMKKLSATLKEEEEKLKEVEEKWVTQQLLLPMIPFPSVPVGKDEKGNKEVRREGTPPKFSFPIKDHVALGNGLGLFDIPRGVKIAGARSYFLTGDGARLHSAIIRFAVDSLVAKGWTLFIPPLLANWECLMGTGFFPGAEEQTYSVGAQRVRAGEVEADNLFLIGTAEVSVASYHKDEVLPLSDLPLRYCGASNCFRREAGTYGKDTHGLYRLHQFEKVEQVVVCEADTDGALKIFEEIRTNAEDVLKAFELPYRVIDVCTGDMGRGKVFMQDIETWMPSREAYGETHSCSYLGDFQARRLGIKYEDAEGVKRIAHTLNNTCIASPRILIPFLENHQQKDGSVAIPKALQPYMNGQVALKPRG